MIKLIPVARLVPGMFVHDLNCGWIEHDFLRRAFAVRDEATAARVRAIGVHEIYIDTRRGADVDEAADADLAIPGAGAPRTAGGGESERLACAATDDERGGLDGADNAPVFANASTGAEIDPVRALHREALQLVRELMTDVRFGRPLRIGRIAPVVEGLVASVFRQPDTLLPLVRLKEHDEYTFMHSVSTCALLANFGHALQLPDDEIREMAIGALLHDIGKAHVPDGILNKPAKLSAAEFDTMKTHVVQTKIILQNTPGISDIALDVAAQHHERSDGSGYPNRLSGGEISRHGRMGAIVDVYDALTSDRVYHKGLPPGLALRKLYESSDKQLDRKLVHAFIRSLGIYPSGSLVRLESGGLAVVQEQNPDNALQPRLLVIFDSARHAYVAPHRLDLAEGTDRIVQYEDFAHWGIDARQWLPGAKST